MKKERVKIGELNFELLSPEAEDLQDEDIEVKPTLEVENDASMVYVKMNRDDAVRLRSLLDHFLEAQ